ncbi:alpha/beta hydrolase family protein [Sphingomonas sp. PB4P5]|uniref:alpha/beta hydrolase family protein n=1 Tax=Parasphingomonas puruogangriensis TaxID=3096155 RepID=UPI002FC8EBFC
MTTDRLITCAVALVLTAAAAPPADPPSAAAKAPPPIEAFAELPFMATPTVSPNGTQVAARVSVNGKQALAIIPLEPGRKIVGLGTGTNDLNSWTWVNDDWLVARVGGTQGVQGDKWYLRRAVGIKADGTKTVPLAKDAGQNADDILWIASDGTPRIRMALQTSIYSNEPGFWPMVREYDVSTGRATTVLRPTEKVMDWYADGGGIVRLGIAYDDTSRGYRLLYRDRAEQSFRTVAKARGTMASLGDVPAMFLAEPGKGIAFSDDDGFDALYEFDLATLKTGKKLFGKPGYDIGGIITDAAGGRAIGVRYTDTAARTHWFDPELARVQSEIDKAVGTRRARIVSWSRDFSTLMVLVGGADRPGSYYVYRPAEGTMKLLAHTANLLPPAAYAPVSTITYKARDGLEIAAVLTVPKGRAAKNLPLILMPHGGPAARDDESWDWWTQFLASRGYAVLQPNYRGSVGYGTAFEDMGKGQWGLKMQDDLTDAVKWAADSGLADAKRVCIVGASYGGYAALRAAERDTGVYRCAVSFAGVSDMPAMLRYDGRFLNGNRSKDYLRAQAPDLKSVSPINHAAAFSIPLLMVHGKADTVVPVDQSRDMASKLKAAGKPFRYVEQPKGDHHFSQGADRLQFLQELEAFLKVNNPA